jgi:hypothetical protein
MKREKIKCSDCGVSISKSGLSIHKGSKACLKNQKNGITVKGICKHCGIDTSEMNQSDTANHVRWCDKNPKRKSYTDTLTNTRSKKTNTTAWNKGLTKETDERVAAYGNTQKRKYANGELIPYFLGKSHSSETKELLRHKALNNNFQRVCKSTVEYQCIDGTVIKMDSSWEVKLAEELDNNGVEWIRPESLPWIDADGINHNYFPDFYIPLWDVYLDPKNDWVIKSQAHKLQCLSEQYDNIYILGKKDLNLESIQNIIK